MNKVLSEKLTVKEIPPLKLQSLPRISSKKQNSNIYKPNTDRILKVSTDNEKFRNISANAGNKLKGNNLAELYLSQDISPVAKHKRHDIFNKKSQVLGSKNSMEYFTENSYTNKISKNTNNTSPKKQFFNQELTKANESPIKLPKLNILPAKLNHMNKKKNQSVSNIYNSIITSRSHLQTEISHTSSALFSNGNLFSKGQENYQFDDYQSEMCSSQRIFQDKSLQKKPESECIKNTKRIAKDHDETLNYICKNFDVSQKAENEIIKQLNNHDRVLIKKKLTEMAKNLKTVSLQHQHFEKNVADSDDRSVSNSSDNEFVKKKKENWILIGGNKSTKTKQNNDQVLTKEFSAGVGEVFFMECAKLRFPLEINMFMDRICFEVYVSTRHDNPNSGSHEFKFVESKFRIEIQEEEKNKIEKIYITIRPFINFKTRIYVKFSGELQKIEEKKFDSLPYDIDITGRKLHSLDYKSFLIFTENYDINLLTAKAKSMGMTVEEYEDHITENSKIIKVNNKKVSLGPYEQYLASRLMERKKTFEKNRLVAKNFGEYKQEMEKFTHMIAENRVKKYHDNKEIIHNQTAKHNQGTLQFSLDFEKRKMANIHKFLLLFKRNVAIRVWVKAIKTVGKIIEIQENLQKIKLWRKIKSARMTAAMMLSIQLKIWNRKANKRTYKIREEIFVDTFSKVQKDLERVHYAINFLVWPRKARINEEVKNVIAKFFSITLKPLTTQLKFQRYHFIVRKCARRFKKSVEFKKYKTSSFRYEWDKIEAKILEITTLQDSVNADYNGYKKKFRNLNNVSVIRLINLFYDIRLLEHLEKYKLERYNSAEENHKQNFNFMREVLKKNELYHIFKKFEEYTEKKRFGQLIETANKTLEINKPKLDVMTPKAIGNPKDFSSKVKIKRRGTMKAGDFDSKIAGLIGQGVIKWNTDAEEKTTIEISENSKLNQILKSFLKLIGNRFQFKNDSDTVGNLILAAIDCSGSSS